MRILFIVIGNSRRSNVLNGNTLRYDGGGGSGTDTSSILVAEYLASIGHEVVMVTERLEPQLYKPDDRYTHGKKINGVFYTDLNFTNIENRNFDILISSLWFQDYENLKITVNKALIYWCHMQWIYGLDHMLEYSKKNNIPLGYVNISNWEKIMNAPIINTAKSRYNKVYECLIPNPICDDVIEQVISENITKKPHKFIFHASWARGGNVAVDAIEKLPYEDKELHAFDYLITIHDHKYPFFHRHDGVDKITLYRHIAESEYFLYPLYTPYKDVHKDTFSCVVAEAIALGAIPITYPLGALPEYYNGHCAWIDFPAGIDSKVLQQQPLTKDEDGVFKNNIPAIISKIQELENNINYKNSIRDKGKEYILNNFNIKRVGDMWVNFINEITL